jgi:hypothetical protein
VNNRPAWTENVTKDGAEDAPPSVTGRPWPKLDDTALYGLPGKIVNAIGPHTEADPAAMLFTLFAGSGAMIGRAPHVLTGGVEHGARIWPLVIGRTAGGVKGTSYAEIRRVLKEADPLFCAEKIVGGLSSAEGLIQQVRDGVGDDPDDTHFDEGVTDKRLLVVESEFASVLAQGKRDGNTLLPDGGDLSEATLKGLGAELAEVIEKASKVQRMRRTSSAAKYWQDLYKRLVADHAGDGTVAQVVARAAPQVLRLSVTAALLDGSEQIDQPHLEAAEAMWAYVEDSAWYVFGSTSGNPDLDRLKSFVDNAESTEGVSRTAIRTDCFGRHRTKEQIDFVVGELLSVGDYEEWQKPGKGRPVLFLRRLKR